MSINTIMFDLDGTLLPMDLEVFIKAYFGKIAAWLTPYGFEPKRLIDTIWRGTGAMIQNNGSMSNEAAFWSVMETEYGSEILSCQDTFDRFYDDEFGTLHSVCGYSPISAEIITMLKDKGYQVVLATNPIFPRKATYWRIQWAGLKPEDFEFITTYENCSYTKPTLDYYQEILNKIGVPPEQCMMIGNDVTEDMVAAQMGMEVFLLTDCLINKHNQDINLYPHGTICQLSAQLDKLPSLT